MVPPIQGSSLSQDSTLNRTPRENFYISRYEGPNEISQDFTDMAHSLFYVVKVSYTEGETVTRESPYKFSILNSPEISHLEKICISTDW